MARLIVAAAAEDSIATPGNREPTYIVVSVTDDRGRAVTGLGVSNFRVTPVVVGAGGAEVNIMDNIFTASVQGFYMISVVPIQEETWKAGVYIFGVAVERGSDRGQALATVLMD